MGFIYQFITSNKEYIPLIFDLQPPRKRYKTRDQDILWLMQSRRETKSWEKVLTPLAPLLWFWCDKNRLAAINTPKSKILEQYSTFDIVDQLVPVLNTISQEIQDKTQVFETQA